MDRDYCVCVLKFSVFHFFFFFGFHAFQEVMWLLFINSSYIGWLFHDEQYTRTLFMDPQISLFSNFFIKNKSHGTIHIFKNYFATVFSVFSFQFQQNKFYPNGPVIYQVRYIYIYIYFLYCIYLLSFYFYFPMNYPFYDFC